MDTSMSAVESADDNENASEDEVIPARPPLFDTQSTTLSTSSQKTEIMCDDIVTASQSVRGEEFPQDADCCPICLDPWADAGDHRLTCLKCGHLFGRGCIVTWLSDNKTCPSCKKRATKRDLRNLFCNKMVAVEESAITQIRTALNDALADRQRLAQELQIVKVKNAMLEKQMAMAEKVHKQELPSVAKRLRASRLRRKSVLHLSMEDGCRVMDHNVRLNVLVATMKYQASLFGSYGLTKINIRTCETVGSIPLHSKVIRDVKFKPDASLLMTVSLDKTAKILDTLQSGPALTYTGNAPIWSCAWDTRDPNCCYLGEQQGDISVLDIRNIGQRVGVLKVENDKRPTVSLAMLPHAQGTQFPLGALVVARMNSVRIYERPSEGISGSTPYRDVANVQGPIYSMASSTRNMPESVLLSVRPSVNHVCTRHIFGTLSKVGDSTAELSPVYTYNGGGEQSVMSRGWLSPKYAAAYLETNRTVNVWSVETGFTLMDWPTNTTVMDVSGLEYEGTDYVLVLDERRLDVLQME